MKFKTGLVSLLVVCGACSQATKETDVVKDSFDFAGQQLKYAFTQIDSAKASMPEEQLKRKPVSPRTIEDNGALRLLLPEIILCILIHIPQFTGKETTGPVS